MTMPMGPIRGIAHFFSADWIMPSGKPDAPRSVVTILDVLGPKEVRR